MIPLPEGFRIELDPSTRTYGDGALLVGGSPMRALALSPAGRTAICRLQEDGAASPAARMLGRRLVDSWMARAVPPVSAEPGAATVIIPVRDRPAELERCLLALGRQDPVIVVDDGSGDAGAIAAVCDRHGARLIRRGRSGGPAAARNTAMPLLSTEYVAFLDSDCVPAPGWTRELGRHLSDPSVGAVAPRITPLSAGPRTSALRRYATCRSPIDMGPRGGEVRPGMPVAYVPSAALLVRRTALGLGFDESLRYGEDVDLIWRLNAADWHVRYAPEVCVGHDEPSSWAALLGRRYHYGTSAAALARRHPGRLPAVALPLGPALTAALLLGRRPRHAAAGLALAGWRASVSIRRAGAPGALGPWLGLQSVGWAALALGRASTMLAPGALAMGIRRPSTRAAALALLLAPPLADFVRRRPPLDPLRFTAAAITDDVAYGVGVWSGCVRTRTFAPLVPSIRL